MDKVQHLIDTRWALERVQFALPETITLLSVGVAVVVSRWFLLLTAFVGANQWLYVVLGTCPASGVRRRACHLLSASYANHDGGKQRDVLRA